MRIGYLLTGLLLLGPACAPSARVGSEDGGLRLLADRRAYAPADTITLTVVNDADRPLGYGICTGELQRQTADGWEASRATFFEDPEAGGMNCDLDLPGVEPGGRASVSYRLHQALEAGTYRWCANAYELVDPLARGSTVFCSEPFAIARRSSDRPTEDG